ncbi:uncharacterized protein N7525_008887 [Penicillium rubens]|uniref:uncharacterized protein n=1 Tax=Penicillium rubens TaxID=1108849 RepID=UPI002A5A23D2|nr:uncharacterized protein N7525_008887 [Penicillium rubens]KAJ5830634.1 hypothetical protein N7525_008887 [Penicillium rubens]
MDDNGSIGMEEGYTPIDSPGSWATSYAGPTSLCTIKSIIEDREAARTTHDNMGDEDMSTVYQPSSKTSKWPCSRFKKPGTGQWGGRVDGDGGEESEESEGIGKPDRITR